MTTALLRVEATGPLALFEDAGRPGRLHQGVSGSGFADRRSARLANRLVGNDEEEAVIEALLGGVSLRVQGAAAVIAVTGASAPIAVEDAAGTARAMPTGAALTVPDGGRLVVGNATAGLRACIAVRGGYDVVPILGSRSRDTLAGFGPPPLAVGDEIRVAARAGSWPALEFAVSPPPFTPGAILELPIELGPDPLAAEQRQGLVSRTWTVSARGDRVGVLLEGPAPLSAAAAIPSAGTVRGAVEVPPDGFPFVLMADHPATVGYPVVAVVDDPATDLLAQARPGTPIRFRLR